MQYWLMKSEPDVFSLDNLKQVNKEPWDGVRNYQARNYMREMQLGDLVLFYHSNCSPPGIAGTATIVGTARPDPTQFDPQSKYYDSKSNKENPRWDLVDVEYRSHFQNFLSLAHLKTLPQLENMPILRKGNRLSITPVREQEYQFILQQGGLSN